MNWKNRRRHCLALVLCIASLTNIHGELRKDPFLGAALSWFIPGMGQVYAGDVWRGGLYWTIDTTLFWATLLNIATVDFGIEGDAGFGVAIRFRPKPSTGRILATIGLGACFLAFRLFNVVDAAESVNEYNMRLWEAESAGGLSVIAEPLGLTGISYSVAF
jgi:hypothetical protein